MTDSIILAVDGSNVWEVQEFIMDHHCGSYVAFDGSGIVVSRNAGLDDYPALPWGWKIDSSLRITLPCPHCFESDGFHIEPCTEYAMVPDDLRGPGNSKDFMPWLRAKLNKPPEGWELFGTNVDAGPDVRIEFSTEVGADLMPRWERVREAKNG